MRPAGGLTEKLLRDGIISASDRDVVEYGLEIMGSNLLGAAMTLLIGSCFGYPVYGLILWMLIFPLRKNAGGFHAETRTGCLIASAGMLTAAFACFTCFAGTGRSAAVCLPAAAVFGGVIFFLAPVGNPNKLLDPAEQDVYRRRTRIVLAGEGLLLAFALLLEWEMLTAVTTMSFFTVGVSLLAGRIRLRRMEKTAFSGKQ